LDRLIWKKERRVQVFVRDNNVDQALKALKRKLQREGVFREMKLRKHYESPPRRKSAKGPAKKCSGKVFCHQLNLGWNELPEEERVRRALLALGLDRAFAKSAWTRRTAKLQG
jgi:ribosomal protein S21